MVTGNFYYLKDSYYNKFPNCNLIGNKADDGDEKHDRPCFYCFEKDGIYWMIPISSQIEKYEILYNEKCNDMLVILMEFVLAMLMVKNVHS